MAIQPKTSWFYDQSVARNSSRASCPTNATGLIGYPRCLAHQTYCDESGQARPSLGWVRAAAFAVSSAPNLLRRVGTSPTVALACERWRAGIGVRALAFALWRPSCVVACKLRGSVQAERWRARGQRPRKQREAGPGAQASQQVWCATPSTPPKKPQRSSVTGRIVVVFLAELRR